MNGTQDKTWRAGIVTAIEEFTGCMVVEGGVIRSQDPGDTGVAGAEDWQGKWLLPGMVELHIDNLEKHMVPRPGVFWNAHSPTVIHGQSSGKFQACTI
uniref:hypothetical protein n=1 Tax=Polaromonas sp. W11N TaxID=1840303 RepID=UPI0015E80E8F|nr:hypothetical protein [Polaromonas sp. W11N]